MAAAEGQDTKKQEQQELLQQQQQQRQQQQQQEAYADALPTIVASLISATLATYILRALSNERELLFALFALLTLNATALRYVAQFLFRWDDGVVDSFEHANLRPLLFVSSMLYFITVNFGVTILTDSVTLFQMPSLFDLLLSGLIILATVFFLLPFFLNNCARPAPTPAPRPKAL
jgi:hypothetical protein